MIIIEVHHDIPSDLACLFHILCSCLQRKPDYVFRMRATATDQGADPNMSETDVEILVVDSKKKSPSFTTPVEMNINLKENYSDFSTPVATFNAV
jgi:hypothetical protein